MHSSKMCEPRNRDNGASDVWALTAYRYGGILHGRKYKGEQYKVNQKQRVVDFKFYTYAKQYDN